jgi:nucleoside-diphosphate-sugar epimerase
MRAAGQGCDTLVNVASIGFGHGPGVVEAAERCGIKRAVFVSTTAIFTNLNAPSKAVRVAAETAIRDSSLAWTIIRPTMIYGTARDRNLCRLIRYIRKYPILPIFGSGEFMMQPIFVDDLASAIVASVETSKTARKEYNVAGQSPLTYNELVRTVARLMGRRLRLLHLPFRPMMKFLGISERLRVRLPIKSEQLSRLNEHKAFPWDRAGEDFGFSPRAFHEGIETEIRSMGIPVVSQG